MSVYIIAEAGSNWRVGSPPRDMEMARTLIDVAAEAGADAVKFQVFRAETITAPSAGPSPHLEKMGISTPIEEIFRELAMPYEMLAPLSEYAQEQGIDFLASCFSKEDFEAVDRHVSAHKIASAELHHPRLLQLAARSGKPLYMSTGASTEEEIDWAIETFRAAGGKKLTLLHCTMQYPAVQEAMNLRSLTRLASRFGLPVGLSDHSRDPICAPVAAVALGAQVIEKHYTLHNRLVGPDHSWTITPDELTRMVAAIRMTERMLGEERRGIFPEEEELAKHYRRTIQAIQAIRAGDLLQEGVNIAILRPGGQITGLHPRSIERIEGRRAARDLMVGTGILEGDFL
jgi:sialic acid synthase SpsE